jgi:hypothetical protein
MLTGAMFAGMVFGCVIVPGMLAVCRADIGSLFGRSGVNPVGGLIDVSDVSLIGVRITDHNHRRKLAQTFSNEPAQDIWRLVGDAQPIQLVHALGMLRATHPNTQPRRGWFAECTNPFHLAVFVQPESVTNGTHPAGVMPTQQPRFTLLGSDAGRFMWQGVQAFCGIVEGPCSLRPAFAQANDLHGLELGRSPSRL